MAASFRCPLLPSSQRADEGTLFGLQALRIPIRDKNALFRDILDCLKL